MTPHPMVGEIAGPGGRTPTRSRSRSRRYDRAPDDKYPGRDGGVLKRRLSSPKRLEPNPCAAYDCHAIDCLIRCSWREPSTWGVMSPLRSCPFSVTFVPNSPSVHQEIAKEQK